MFFCYALPVYAGKISFDLNVNAESGTLDSAEFSGSTGGNYAGTVNLGGTFFFNDRNLYLGSFDVFSSLDSVQQTNFLFAAGVRVFALSASYADEEGNQILDASLNYGLMPGLDIGYRFPTYVPTVLVFSLDYAPKLTIIGDAEEVWQNAINYEIMFTPIVIGKISYKYSIFNIKQDVPNDYLYFENNIGFGIKIRF